MTLDPELAAWLDAHADGLDCGSTDAAALLPRLATAGLIGAGVPIAAGGSGGSCSSAIGAVAALARHSQAAAFVLWAQRVFIEYLLQSPNRALAEAYLPGLLAGTTAGASGLSNAMKFLGGIEALQVEARRRTDGWQLDGRLPWATNLLAQRFVVAVAASDVAGGAPAVFAVPATQAGVQRSADLDLVGLRGTATAALALSQVPLGPEHLLHEDARSYLPRVRPAFLGMQCGLSIGLARRCLASVRGSEDSGRALLAEPAAAIAADLDAAAARLSAGVDTGAFVDAPRALFLLRIQLAELAQQAAQLELQARGGAGYLHGRHGGFARRWREAAFLPIVTPSLVQLRTELARGSARQAA